MKKLLIFALLVLPMTAFAASSVRVLGTGMTPGAGAKTTTTTSGAAKVTPAKITAAKPASGTTSSSASGSNASRIGAIRVKPKTTTGTVSGTTSSSGSRFPVITPAQSYKTVNSQQAAGNTASNSGTVSPTPAAVSDDPRFDMILSGADSAEEIRADWVNRVGKDLVEKREREGYVFMWVEE